MLDYAGAVALAQAALPVVDAMPEGDALVLLLQHTIERPFGWVFFYTSRLYAETGEVQYALAGNAPIIVNRHSKEVLPTGTAQAVEQYIVQYEKHLAAS